MLKRCGPFDFFYLFWILYHKTASKISNSTKYQIDIKYAVIPLFLVKKHTSVLLPLFMLVRQHHHIVSSMETNSVFVFFKIIIWWIRNAIYAASSWKMRRDRKTQPILINSQCSERDRARRQSEPSPYPSADGCCRPSVQSINRLRPQTRSTGRWPRASRGEPRRRCQSKSSDQDVSSPTWAIQNILASIGEENIHPPF